MSHSYSPMSKQRDESVGAPSLRGNRSASLALTTSWQDVLYTGTSTYNTRAVPFPKPIATTQNVLDSTQPMVYLDSAGRLLRFQGIASKTYDVLANFKITATALLSLANLTTPTVQLRFVIPAPTMIAFPLPDVSDGCTELVAVGATTEPRFPSCGLPITCSPAMQQYGLGVQLRLSTALPLGATATVNAADLILYGR